MKKRLKRPTNFLLPRNSFIVGIGSILNLSGSYFDYTYSKSANEADFKAISSDWENVGEDFRKAKKSFKESNRLCSK